MRKNYAKDHVWNVLLYGCKTWIINKQDKKKLKAMGMWTRRRLLKVSWIDMKSNIGILNQKKKKRILLNIIKEKSRKIFGHLLRHNSFMTKLFEGRINGYKRRGRPWKGMYRGNYKTSWL